MAHPARSSINPYQFIRFPSFTPDKLLAIGYEAHYTYWEPRDIGDTRALCSDISRTVDAVRDFFWTHLELLGTRYDEKMPPFFVYFENSNACYDAYYVPKSADHKEYFVLDKTYTSCPEVICHEFTHAVIENINSLGNTGEAGALNESIADVIGIVFKRHRCLIEIKDWKIGNLRDLSQKIELPKPFASTYDKEGKTTNDNGNVHYNSLLLSHAFYLVSEELAKKNADPEDKQLVKIWWTAFENLKENEKTFGGFINKTITVAGSVNSIFMGAVIEAWKSLAML